ncbi:MAG: LysM peptidoglycan-binding domain-containing protein [Bacteroidota bacterium]|nr:LysM peptidoglycan-binding domain-containing protein [Bacteroidota bacterium]
MNKFIFSSIFILFINLVSAQVLRQHRVDAQDTLESIAQRYGVLQEDIVLLNPEAKAQLNPGKLLVIPNPIQKKVFKTKEIQKVISYKVHRVKKKETLHSIAKKYNVTVEAIKDNNQQLFEAPLKFKDKIYIPKFKMQTVVVTPKALRVYKVKPKEGKWRIAYKFGISVLELEALNPNMGPDLELGQTLFVPNIEAAEEQTVTEAGFDFYKVLPKEGYYRLYKKLGISQDSLEQLNPVLKQTGLKQGMVLKVPKASTEGVDLYSTDLSKQIKYLSPKKIALLLPFKSNSIDFDSIQLAKQQIQRDGYIRIATEFYAGVEMALDSAKALGISTNLDVFDTEANPNKTSRLLSSEDFSKYDLVLGPMTLKNCQLVAESLKTTNTPVVSPFVKFDKRSSNLIQSIPDDQWMADKLLTYAKKDSIPHQTVVISDSKSMDRVAKIRNAYPDLKILTSKRDIEGKEQYYIEFESVQKALSPGRTLVFLETNNESFASNVTSMLNGLNGLTLELQEAENDAEEEVEIEVERELILMTTNHNKAFKGSHISNSDLSNLNFQFPSVYNYKEGLSDFGKNYNSRYGNYPSRYATRGFDLALDLLLRLAAFESCYEELTNNQTKYLENKFKYAQPQSGGFINQSAYILKYQDLFILKMED